ncbi:MAG: dehydrogenase [Deltaproteobacteria bacterium RIFOXYD12_FULL_57_12]|nr:MAG: dehydrogenase [Deltaproteobacteria bacterium RIFOXYD12_FULL_57_12]
MPDLRSSLGARYLQETKFRSHELLPRSRPRIEPAPLFKRYPEAERLALPARSGLAPANLWALLQTRRSKRAYAVGRPISLADFALLCWAAQGVTARAGDHLLRTAPSAGALYPIETYMAVTQVAGLDPGLFHLNVPEFAVERLSSGAAGQAVAQASLGQAFLAEGAVIFIWSAVLRRNMSKYGQRGLRYILLDAGHICQNLLLAAEALGLAACPVAAFFDDELNRLLSLDGEEESVVYLAAIGTGEQVGNSR